MVRFGFGWADADLPGRGGSRKGRRLAQSKPVPSVDSLRKGGRRGSLCLRKRTAPLLFPLLGAWGLFDLESYARGTTEMPGISRKAGTCPAVSSCRFESVHWSTTPKTKVGKHLEQARASLRTGCRRPFARRSWGSSGPGKWFGLQLEAQGMHNTLPQNFGMWFLKRRSMRFHITHIQTFRMGSRMDSAFGAERFGWRSPTHVLRARTGPRRGSVA